MKQLVYELRQLCFHNRDGSFTTQYQRRAMLTQMGHQLIALGYRTFMRRRLKAGIGISW